MHQEGKLGEEILLHDLETAEYYTLIGRRLKAKGKHIPINDTWIATNGMKGGLALYTFGGNLEKTKALLLFSAMNP